MCTRLPRAARRRRPRVAAHAHHDPAGEGARCVGCHMPRIVYGVLDVHRSHRIEIPKVPPASARCWLRAAPDACTLCHVEGLAGREDGSVRRWRAVRRPIRSGARSPPTRWAARRRSPATSARAGSGRCSRSMAERRYPAVRHIAWRSLRRLIAPGAAPGAGLARRLRSLGRRRARPAAVVSACAARSGPALARRHPHPLRAGRVARDVSSWRSASERRGPPLPPLRLDVARRVGAVRPGDRGGPRFQARRLSGRQPAAHDPAPRARARRHPRAGRARVSRRAPVGRRRARRPHGASDGDAAAGRRAADPRGVRAGGHRSARGRSRLARRAGPDGRGLAGRGADPDGLASLAVRNAGRLHKLFGSLRAKDVLRSRLRW